MRRRFSVLGALLVCALPAIPATAQAAQGSRFHPVVSGPAGVVATESPAAARAGRTMLEAGGNAVDAAAATVFALGVARPQSCGLGGGGFMVYRSPDGKARTLDFRETAPAAFRPDTLTGPGLHTSFTGHLTVGVPGTLAGMDAALERFGTMRLADALRPAERLARLGFRVPTSLSGAMRSNLQRIALFLPTAQQFLRDGQPFQPGDVLVQEQLAGTLRRIMRFGPGTFYGGTIAKRIVRDMRASRPETKDPGLLTVKDFKAYKALWRPVLRGSYRGSEVLSMPPPTSGGVAIQQMLNILEGFDLAALGQSSAQTIHLVAEAQKLAWADRGAYLADPAFVPQPTATLTSKAYAEGRRALLNQSRAGSYGPGDVGAGAAPRTAGADFNPNGSTTHVSIIDRRGGAVSLTCTIEQEFGSAVVAPGTGILLNNELTDFSAPGTANEPAPGKRPRSSMSPTIVVRDGKPVLVTGGAGGSRIIMGILHTILDTTDFGQDLAQAVDAQRYDDQGTSRLEIEEARIDPAVLADLQGRGWTLVPRGEYHVVPRIQLAGVNPSGKGAIAVSDSRSDRGAVAERPPITCTTPKPKGPPSGPPAAACPVPPA